VTARGAAASTKSHLPLIHEGCNGSNSNGSSFPASDTPQQPRTRACDFLNLAPSLSLARLLASRSAFPTASQGFSLRRKKGMNTAQQVRWHSEAPIASADLDLGEPDGFQIRRQFRES